MLSEMLNRDELAVELGYPTWDAVAALLRRSAYRISAIRQKGRWRRIAEPTPELKQLQRRLAVLLGRTYHAPRCVHGY
jgi:hypothetical protein